MREITTAIIHCTDTYAGMDWDVADIRRVHVDENGWDDVGYHFVIKRDGTLQTGRPMETPGAHARGYNHDSLGVCLVGGRGDDDKPEFNFTQTQMRKLNALIAILRDLHPGIEVIGHRDVSSKNCPSFDAKAYFDG